MRLVPTGPRRIALLVVPVLLGAGALQPQSPVIEGAAPTAPVVAARSPRVAPVVTPAVAPAPVVAQTPRAPTRAHRLRAASHDRSLEARSPAVRTLQQRGAAALHALDYDWRALGYQVRFEPYTGGRLGRIQRAQRQITVYVRRGQSDLSVRTSLAHELGHALDFEHGTPERRDRYRALRGLSPRGAWFPCDRCDDLGSPAGDFAEVFASWLVGPGDFRSRLKGPPDASQLRALAPLFTVAHRAADPTQPAPTPTPTPTPTATSSPKAGTAVLPPLLQPTPTPRAAQPARARSGDDARRP